MLDLALLLAIVQDWRSTQTWVHLRHGYKASYLGIPYFSIRRIFSQNIQSGRI